MSTTASGEEEETESATVVAVAASQSGSIAVGVQGYSDVLLLRVTKENTLELVQRAAVDPAANICRESPFSFQHTQTLKRPNSKPSNGESSLHRRHHPSHRRNPWTPKD